MIHANILDAGRRADFDRPGRGGRNQDLRDDCVALCLPAGAVWQQADHGLPRACLTSSIHLACYHLHAKPQKINRLLNQRYGRLRVILCTVKIYV